MKIGVYFCKCGTNISEKIDSEVVKQNVSNKSGDLHFKEIDFMCSESGLEEFKKDLKGNDVDRVVIAACSPRDHENTFMKAMAENEMNPYLMQMVNIREQVAWVTEDPKKATEKATKYINAAMGRVKLNHPLEKKEIDMSSNVLILGAGPAGLKSALAFAEAGRKVTVVEKSPAIGGLPVRYEEIFPHMECGPCMLEPVMADFLHGPHAENIELLSMAEVKDVAGFLGNFDVTIQQKARYINIHDCVGCYECIEPCPVSTKNEFNFDMDERKAIAFSFTGALPNAPFIDDSTCVRFNGEDCKICEDACPVENAVNYEDTEKTIELKVGAILVAIGSDIYDCTNFDNLGYGKLPDVYTNIEFERILASNGPTSGELVLSNGEKPKSISIVHCVGSLDKDHVEYCSGICCSSAFKFNRLIHHHLPETKVNHFYKEISISDKNGFELYDTAKKYSEFIRYFNISEFKIVEQKGQKVIEYKNGNEKIEKFESDLIVLCPAVVPHKGAGSLGDLLELSRDKYGFFEDMNDRLASAHSKVQGIYLAGTCQSPMDIQKSVNHSMAASAHILSIIQEGKKLEVSPVCAVSDTEKCSGCRICAIVCPYKAITFSQEDGKSIINDVLCQGCGTCVAGCPSNAIVGNHFTNEQLVAEIEEILS